MDDYKPEEIELCEIVVKSVKGKVSSKKFKGGNVKNIQKATKYYQNVQLRDKYAEGLYKVKVYRVWHIVRHFKH